MPESQHRLPQRIAVVLLMIVALAALLAPWLAPYDPAEQLDSLAGRQLPPFSSRQAIALTDGSWLLADSAERTADGLRIERLGEVSYLPAERVENLDASGVADQRFFLLGSDQFSRDVLSRLLYGARISLFIGLTAVVMAMTLGVLAGAAAALGGRWVDTVIMRTVDGLLSFPWIFLLIALVAVMPPSTLTLVALLGGTAWMGVSRLARGEIKSLAEREFVIAARALGAHPVAILWQHLLPNAMTPLAVEATLRVGRLILVEASLSFLGFGVQAPQASWGTMIADGRSQMFSAWWVSAFPGLALVATVVAISLASDALRDRLDPHQADQTA